MEYFTVQANSHRDAMEKMKYQFGSTARIMTRKSIRFGGFMGLFKREGVEISGYLTNQNPNPRPSPPESVENEKRKILDSVSRESPVQEVLKEIRGLREEMAGQDGLPPVFGRIRELLEQNEFSRSFIEGLVGRLRNEFSLEDLQDESAVQKAVVQWVGESIRISSNGEENHKKPRIIVIVGPTGVGKTTTVAKLAAIYSLGNGNGSPKQVRMVTIDNYKIAAKKQIETYAEIMQIPFSFAESRQELEKVLALYQDVDIILIDTIGKSPSDYAKLGEMQSVLMACGSSCEVHLAVSATTKTGDVEEIFRQFEPFDYESVILTKLDETTRVGNIISVMSDRQKSISYFTDGQMVPQDIERATASRLIMSLQGFQVDRDLIESKFGRQTVDNR